MIQVFHSPPNQINKSKDDREPRRNLSAKTEPNVQKQFPTMHANLDLTNIDHVPSSGTHSGSNVMLYVFEDNEAVIKRIIKGRNPTMRHVSRTHRVALDWVFDKMNLESEIQIRYIDTKHQLADMLTKGNFTRDDWNNLLHWFNISHFSSTCCAKNSSLISCPKQMAKRMQEQKGGENIVAKSKSTARNLSSQVPTSSSTAKIPIASETLEILTATGKPESRMRGNSKSDAASSSQVKLQDAYLAGLMDTAMEKPVATKEESGTVDLSESETWSFQEEAVTERPIACKNATEKPCAPSKSENSGNPKAERKRWPHNLHMSPAIVPHTDAVFSIVRKIYERAPADPMEDLDVKRLFGAYS